MKKVLKTTSIAVLTLAVATGIVYAFVTNAKDVKPTAPSVIPTTIPSPTKTPITTEKPIPPVISNDQYYALTFKTADPSKELSTTVGADNIGTVLKIKSHQ